MLIDQSQCFFIVVLLAAGFGFLRGWARGVLSCALVLGTVLFLLGGGEQVLVRLVFQHLPTFLTRMLQPGADLTVGMATLVAVLGIGHWLGNTFVRVPILHRHRITGMLPGAATGATLIYYLNQHLTSGTQFALSNPSNAQEPPNVALIFALGISVLLLVLSSSVVAVFAIWSKR